VNDVRAATRGRISPEATVSLKPALLLGSYTVLLAAVYYLATKAGIGLRFANSQVGVAWPANAILVCALLLTPRSRWWLVLLATSLAHAAALGDSIPVWRLLWQIAGIAVFAIASVEALRRFAGLPLLFESIRQTVAYICVSLAVPALFALTTAAVVRSALHLENTYMPGVVWLRTTLANATALLLVAPVVLLWIRHGAPQLRQLSARRRAEIAAIVLTLLAVALLAFGTGPEIAQVRGLLVWVFPPLLWAAVRFGPLGASTALFTIAALSLWGTARELGAFILVTEADLVLSLQLFWIAICTPVMLLAAVISERERAEEALQEQRNELAHVTRVTTASELSGALAHELSQPLTSILANAEAAIRLIDRQPPDIREVKEILEDIRQQDERAADVIDRLRLLLKRGQPDFGTLDIETVVLDALKLSRSTVEIAGADVQTQFAPGLPGVRADPVQLLQVVLNLIVNACESMSRAQAHERHLRLYAVPLDGKHVQLSVADSGPGLPKGADEQLFQPFFTTKPNGLGLGLAICRSIATAHRGRLWGENNPGSGATFHLVLPIDGSHPKAASVRT
jgi:signal transduction histidine kinase